MRTPMPRTSSGTVRSSAWKYRPWLDRQAHARLQRAVDVRLGPRGGAVVDVHAEHVAGAVQGPAALQTQLQDTLDRTLDQTPPTSFSASTRCAASWKSRYLAPGCTAAIPASWASYTAS